VKSRDDDVVDLVDVHL